MSHDEQTWVNGAGGATPLSAARLNKIEKRITDIQDGVSLDSFAGADDEARLTAAMAYSSAQTYKPPILLLDHREYGPFTTQREVYSGFKLLGGPAFSNQYRSALSTPQRVNINRNGPWLVTPSSGQIFDVEISRLSFYAQSSTTDFFQTPGSSVLWTSVFRDLGFNLFRHVFGDSTRQFVMTGCVMDGWFNINNGRNVAMRFGGSDCTLFTQGCLLDSPTSITDAGNVPYHLWCDFLEKSNLGPMYVTCEGIPAGIRITGSASAGGLIFRGGMRVEGRHFTGPSRGSVIRMEGGRATFRDAWLSYGFADPANSGRANEGGVVSVLGGRALFDACWYGRSIAETEPWIYADGASTRVRIRNAEVVHDGGSFTGLPRVQAVNGAALDVDNSVTVL